MGRMSDARKRARQRPQAAPAARPPQPPAPPAAEPARPLESALSWQDADSFQFPAEPEAAAAPVARLTLPASGTAEEILGRAELAAMAAPPAATAGETALAVPAAPAQPAEAAVARSHNISFLAGPARDDRKASEVTEHLVSFYLGGEEYGVDVRLVQEIIRITEITQVPRAPEFIKGVINLRGRIIPVVDLKRKLGLGEVEHTRQARIVVVKVRERLMGLLVDGASQVLKVPASVIEPPPEEVVEIDANYIRGVAKLEKRLIILVELQKILALEVREASALLSPA